MGIITGENHSHFPLRTLKIMNTTNVVNWWNCRNQTGKIDSVLQYKSGVFASTGSSKNRQKHPKGKTPDFLKFPWDFSSAKCTFCDTIKH